MAPQYKLTYFDARARAEAARLLFAYAGVPYEDERLTREVWPTKKANYPWGSIPVLEVDGKVLAQSSAILRYLGKVHNLAGENDFESAKCDEMVEALADLTNAAAPVFREQDETKKAELIEKVKTETFPKFLTQWEKVLNGNGGFLVGKKFSYADFAIANSMELFNAMLGGYIFDNYPTMKKHFESVMSAKGIKEWVAKRPKTPF